MWNTVLVAGSGGRRMAQSDLKNVAKALAKLRAAEREFRLMILRAHESGETYRDIGQRAGLSHQRINDIVRDEKRRRAEETG